MAALDRVLKGIKEVLVMTEEIKRVAATVKELAIEVREMDKRLVRVETVVEMATKAGITTKQRLSHD